MVTTAVKTATICHLEQLCRVVSAVSQGQVFLNPPLTGNMITAKSGEPTKVNSPKPYAKMTDGLLTSAIVEGRLACWLFN